MKLVAGRGEADGDATSADPGWLLGNYPPLEEPWATARAAGGKRAGCPEVATYYPLLDSRCLPPINL
jgi:hypothetical protein